MSCTAFLLVASALAVDTIELPPPTGPHAIGTRRWHWRDDSRAEGATEDPDDRRELPVQVWYPARASDAGDTDARASYLRESNAWDAVFGEARAERLARVRTNARADAEFARPEEPDEPAPLVLFLHGWGTQGSVYTALLEELASHGFVVAAIDQPYQGRIPMPDGTVTTPSEAHFGDPMNMVECYGRDLTFVLDRLLELNEPDGFFAGGLAERAATVGHSNGAIGALRAAMSDDRVGACVAVDQWDPAFESIFDLDVPLLLLRTGGAPAPAETYFGGASAPVLDVTLTGAGHMSCSDWPLHDAADPAARERAVANLDAIRRTLRAFLEDAFLGRDPGALEAAAARDERIEIRSPAR